MADHSVQESGGDFTSLEDAVEDGDTSDGQTIEISGTWNATTGEEDTQIAVADALTITAVGDSKHDGRPWASGETTWRHRNDSSGHSFTITDTGSVIFDGLDIQNASGGTSDEIFRNNVSNTFLARNCVLGFDDRYDQQDVYYNEAVSDATFESCQFYNVYRGVVDIVSYDTGSVININSCTGFDLGNSTGDTSRSGLVGATQVGTPTLTVNIYNSIMHMDTGSPITLFAGTPGNVTLNVDRSATTSSIWVTAGYSLDVDDDNDESITVTDSIASSAYILVDTTTIPYDLKLQDHANNIAQTNHSDGTGVGLTIPSTDIIGNTRATVYDMGSHEFTASGGGSGNPHYYYAQQ